MFGSVRSSVLLLCDQTSLWTYSLMFANCLVFCDVWHVQSSILGQNVTFGKFNVRAFNVWSVRSSVLLLCDQTSLGTNSLMFTKCKVFCDNRHVQSSILGQNVMFGHSMFGVFEVRSCCYMTRLVLELTVWCSQTVQFLWCSKFNFGPKCDVWKVRCSDIQSSECSKLGILVVIPRLINL